MFILRAAINHGTIKKGKMPNLRPENIVEAYKIPPVVFKNSFSIYNLRHVFHLVVEFVTTFKVTKKQSLCCPHQFFFVKVLCHTMRLKNIFYIIMLCILEET